MSHSRILVPLDGSKTSEAALDQARKMASDSKVELRLLHAWDHHLTGDEVSDESRFKAIEEEHEAYLREWSDKLTLEGITVSSALVQMSPVEAILESTINESIDLVVMTSHGRSGLSRLVLGSVTEKVVREAPCPVLVLGHEYLKKLEEVTANE